MDLASAVQTLIAYEASLKLAQGQKPPPPSPSLFNRLSDAVGAIEQELNSTEPEMRFSRLPPSVWSDWPLCCCSDLRPKELKTARSLSPSLLRERGLLSLFLALHSCAKGGVGHAAHLAPYVLRTKIDLSSIDPVPFPSAHLAARVGHRLINADGTLDFQVEKHRGNLFTTWGQNICVILNVLTHSSMAVIAAVPHEAAGLSLAKETAAMLDALCAAQRGSERAGGVSSQGLNGIPLLMGCYLISLLDKLLGDAMPKRRLDEEVYVEAAALPGYDPVLLLQSFARKTRSDESEIDQEFLASRTWSSLIESCRCILWFPLTCRGPLGKLLVRPDDAYAVMRIGLEDLGLQKVDADDCFHSAIEAPLEDKWRSTFAFFSIQALQSGLVQPEFILRVRPQLLEGLVEGLARGRIFTKDLTLLTFLALLTRSPAVNFHLRKFFSRSGCLQAVQEVWKTLPPADWRRELIRLFGPRAAQLGIKPGSVIADVLMWLNPTDPVDSIVGSFRLGPWLSAYIFDFLIRDFTVEALLLETSDAQLILQYLIDIAEDIGLAVPRRPHIPYGVLMVVELGKACLAFSTLVARALKDIREAGPQDKSVGGAGGAGVSGFGPSGAGSGQQGLRARLVGMAKELSLLRRRVLHELLPLAEAREAALWEGVREEEVVAALQGWA